MNPVVVVSGCTKGIGSSIVNIFAAHGFDVAGCARGKDDLVAQFKDLSVRYPHQRFYFEQCDVANSELLKIFATDVIQEFGRIDVLVNNAGVFITGSIQSEAEGVLERLLTTNVASAYHLTRAFLPCFMAQKAGHIFNICSTASITAYPNGGSYCISKYALLGMTKVLREELKTSKIKVTALLPGATLTNSWQGTDLPEERFIPSDDIAKLVYSAYELSPYSTVEEIVIRPQSGDIL